MCWMDGLFLMIMIVMEVDGVGFGLGVLVFMKSGRLRMEKLCEWY